MKVTATTKNSKSPKEKSNVSKETGTDTVISYATKYSYINTHGFWSMTV